jgi:hypothetical protein
MGWRRFSPHGGQKRKVMEGMRQDTTLKDPPPVTCFLYLAPLPGFQNFAI